MVNEICCHPTGILTGHNLHSLQALTGTLHLKNGWRRYEDYGALEDTFWSTFQDDVGDLSEETMKAIMTARIMGLLRSRSFATRLANMPKATPIHDDEADVATFNL